VSDNNDPNEPDDIKALRAKAGSVDEAVANAIRLERENAFLRAGVADDTPVGKMFAKSYDGELTVEAIVEAATQVGALKTATPPPPPENNFTPEEAAARQQAQQLAAGGGNPAGAPAAQA
jgi:hypothetical protein